MKELETFFHFFQSLFSWFKLFTIYMRVLFHYKVSKSKAWSNESKMRDSWFSSLTSNSRVFAYYIQAEWHEDEHLYPSGWCNSSSLNLQHHMTHCRNVRIQNNTHGGWMGGTCFIGYKEENRERIQVKNCETEENVIEVENCRGKSFKKLS